MFIRPPTADAMTSYPARLAYGPVGPYPLIEQ